MRSRASICLVVAAVLLVTGCVSVSRSQQKSFRVYDIRGIARSQNATLGITPLNPGEALHLADIEARIEAASSCRVDGFYIAELPELNAFVVDKDGKKYLIINRPLLRKLEADDAAMAALIGHELAHVALGHSENRQVVNKAVGVGSHVLAIVAGVFIPGGGTLVNAGGQVVAKTYSRSQERDADEAGLGYAVKAGYEPSGALRLLNALPAPKDGTTGFFDSHPGRQERIERIKALIRERYSSGDHGSALNERRHLTEEQS